MEIFHRVIRRKIQEEEEWKRIDIVDWRNFYRVKWIVCQKTNYLIVLYNCNKFPAIMVLDQIFRYDKSLFMRISLRCQWNKKKKEKKRLDKILKEINHKNTKVKRIKDIQYCAYFS